MVADDWSGCGNFLNETMLKFAASIDSSFHDLFFYSRKGCLVTFCSKVELLSKLESVTSNSVTALST